MSVRSRLPSPTFICMVDRRSDVVVTTCLGRRKARSSTTANPRFSATVTKLALHGNFRHQRLEHIFRPSPVMSLTCGLLECRYITPLFSVRQSMPYKTRGRRGTHSLGILLGLNVNILYRLDLEALLFICQRPTPLISFSAFIFAFASATDPLFTVSSSTLVSTISFPPTTTYFSTFHISGFSTPYITA
jgi:hypothetical protein